MTGEVRLELRPARGASSTARRSENALYAEKLASYGAGETFPHQAAEGFIQIAALETELAAARARAASRACRGRTCPAPGTRMTLWAGRTGGDRIAPEVGTFSAATTRSCCPRLRGDAPPRAAPALRGFSRRTSRRGRASPDRDRREGRSPLARRTRTSTRRSSACSARRGARSTPAARATTRSRRRSACTSRGLRRGASPRSSASRGRRRPRRGRGRHAHARLHAPQRPSRSRSATTCSRGSRCSTVTARASASRAGRPSPCRSGPGRSPGRRSALPAPTAQMRNSLDAVADRDFALDYLYAVRGPLHPPLADRRGARASGRRPSSASCGCPEDGSDGLVDDAAEAESRRRRARARQGRDGDRTPDRPARHGQGAAARLRPRPAGGQAAGLRGAPRRAPRARRPRDARCAASSSTATRMAEPLPTRCSSRPTRPRSSCATGRRSATPTSRSPPQVRDGTFAAPGTPAESVAARAAPGPGGVRAALAEARARFPLRLNLSVILVLMDRLVTDVPVRLGAGGGLTHRLACRPGADRMRCVARRRPRSASVT